MGGGHIDTERERFDLRNWITWLWKGANFSLQGRLAPRKELTLQLKSKAVSWQNSLLSEEVISIKAYSCLEAPHIMRGNLLYSSLPI